MVSKAERETRRASKEAMQMLTSCHLSSYASCQAHFRYLCGTSHYKLEFQSDNSTPLSLKAFIDSDWAGDRVDRKSISGFIVMLDPGAVYWGSKKQTSVSLSTVEAEFVAASTAVRGMWLQRIKWLIS